MFSYASLSFLKKVYWILYQANYRCLFLWGVFLKNYRVPLEASCFPEFSYSLKTLWRHCCCLLQFFCLFLGDHYFLSVLLVILRQIFSMVTSAPQFLFHLIAEFLSLYALFHTGKPDQLIASFVLSLGWCWMLNFVVYFRSTKSSRLPACAPWKGLLSPKAHSRSSPWDVGVWGWGTQSVGVPMS